MHDVCIQDMHSIPRICIVYILYYTNKYTLNILILIFMLIIIGGGVVKHHTCNANLMRNGAEYSVYINTGMYSLCNSM